MNTKALREEIERTLGWDGLDHTEDIDAIMAAVEDYVDYVIGPDVGERITLNGQRLDVSSAIPNAINEEKAIQRNRAKE